MTKDVIKIMDDKYSSMSKGYKKITDFIRENMDHAAFMTAAVLGKEVGISESTVVRYASFLGFKGYPELQSSLSEIIKGRLNTVYRLKNIYHDESKSDIINRVMTEDIARISDTMEMVDTTAFEMAVDVIAKAKNIYVVGIRQDAPLASFLAFYLNLMLGNTRQIQSNSMNEIFEQMLRVSPEDLVIGISFPRYSVRVLKAMEFANERCAQILTISDDIHSPLNMYSSINLIASSASTSIVDSLVAPLSLVNALVVALCVKYQDRVTDNLKMIERLWSDYRISGDDEINRMGLENE